MANFDKAFEKLISNEGCYSNHPNDKGGETIYGISSRIYPQDVQYMKTLNEGAALNHAKTIYRRDYWQLMRLTDIIDQDVAEKVFDMAVNSGAGVAATILQATMNDLGCMLMLDGVLGTATIAAVNFYRYYDVVVKMITYNRIKYYLNIVDVDETQRTFINGWIRRA